MNNEMDNTQIFHVFCSLNIKIYIFLGLKHQVPVFTRELTKYYYTLQSQNSDLLYLIKFSLTFHILLTVHPEAILDLQPT
jgi:hypothetical protein